MGLDTVNPNGEHANGRKARRRAKPTMAKAGNERGINSGRWTDAERRIFIDGLKRFGRGKWKEIATLIPTRSTVQVKTHAQQVMKRVEAGEDVFAEFAGESRVSIGQQDNTRAVRRFAVPANGSATFSASAMDTMKAYDGLSRNDQSAVLTLYQMTQLKALSAL